MAQLFGFAASVISQKSKERMNEKRNGTGFYHKCIGNLLQILLPNEKMVSYLMLNFDLFVALLT
jgi:hypothetical protein